MIDHRAKRTGGWWGGVVAVGVLLAGCGSDDGTSAGTTTSTTDASTTTEAQPAPLPDLGGRLMFSRFNERTHEFTSTHIAGPDGSGEVELTLPGPEGGGRWSTDGQHIAVMTLLDDDRVGTAIITPDGEVERVLAIPDPTLNLVCTVWSPDDARLACEGWDDGDPARQGVYVVNAADGGDLTRLTEPPEGVVDQPGDFTRDGASVVFNRAPDEVDGPLMVVATSGGEPRRVGAGEYEGEGRFSPDGQSIATSTGGTIVVLDLEGEVVHEIEQRGDFLFGPSWSPDGEWLAYSGTSVGPHADIFVSRADGSDVHRITDTPDNEIVVEWSRV